MGFVYKSPMSSSIHSKASNSGVIMQKLWHFFLCWEDKKARFSCLCIFWTAASAIKKIGTQSKIHSVNFPLACGVRCVFPWWDPLYLQVYILPMHHLKRVFAWNWRGVFSPHHFGKKNLHYFFVHWREHGCSWVAEALCRAYRCTQFFDIHVQSGVFTATLLHKSACSNVQPPYPGVCAAFWADALWGKDLPPRYPAIFYFSSLVLYCLRNGVFWVPRNRHIFPPTVFQGICKGPYKGQEHSIMPDFAKVAAKSRFQCNLFCTIFLSSFFTVFIFLGWVGTCNFSFCNFSWSPKWFTTLVGCRLEF